MKNGMIIACIMILVFLVACQGPESSAPNIHMESAWAAPATASPMTGPTATSDMSGMTESSTQTPPMSDMSGMGMGGTNSAVYLVIVNDGDVGDTLTGASTEAARSADLHQTKIENDIAQMIPITTLNIPAHGKVELKPGGYHIMLIGLMRDLKIGDTFKINLQFKISGTISVDVKVQQEQ